MPVPVWWNHGAGIDGHIVRGAAPCPAGYGGSTHENWNRNTDLILRSLRSKRLEGWMQAPRSRPILRDAAKTPLLRMRSEIYSQRFCVSKDEVTETRPAIGAPILGKNPTR
jgi:hypothetical protein